MSYETRAVPRGDPCEPSVGLLQARLFDAIDLKARVTHAHWHVKGWQSLPLHALFDGLRCDIDGVVDLVVARMLALGGEADIRMPATGAAGALYQYPPEARGGETELAALAAGFARFGKLARGDADVAVGLGDAGTADLMARIAHLADRQLLAIEAHCWRR